jgi:hypothetical protein
MKSFKTVTKLAIVGGAVVWLAQAALAGVPLNNLEGVGGVAFNPLAYVSGQNAAASSTNALSDVISKPQFGIWDVRLGKADVDWSALGASFTILNRVELSYGYETIAIGDFFKGGPLQPIHKENVGAKVNLIPENWGGYAFVPAVSVGGIWKHTDEVIVGPHDQSVDYYAVATKLVTQTPLPLLLSAGALSSQEQVTGAAGFDSERKVTGFANADVILPLSIAVGIEYKQGEKYSDFQNANYWDAHLAWLANKNLTLVAAYVNTGDYKVGDVKPFGLGEGVVLSAQYAF